MFVNEYHPRLYHGCVLLIWSMDMHLCFTLKLNKKEIVGNMQRKVQLLVTTTFDESEAKNNT